MVNDRLMGSQISGPFDIRFRLEAPSAEPGSALRMEVNVLVEGLAEIEASSAKAGSGGLQGRWIAESFHHTTTRKTLGVSMGGSQLKQLNAAISSAGLSRSSQPNTNSKKRKRGGAILEHREKRVAKLNEIHEQFNQFDVKVTKLKHDVGGRKLKGVVGKPTASKQAGIEQVFEVSGLSQYAILIQT